MSLNNAAKSQKTHRERHQPQAREHLGLLEKKKDYKLRAKDYNEKKEVLKSLRKKALNKNPDEFYFHMVNSKLTDSGHRDLVSKKVKNNVQSEEQIKLLQTQDLKYISTRRLMESKKIEKLKNTLHLLDSDTKPKNTHTIFVNSEDEKRKLNLAQKFDTEPEILGRSYNRLKKKDLLSKNILEDADEDVIEKTQYKAYKQLQQRVHREKQLTIAEEKMRIKRLLREKKNKPAAIVQEETTTSAPVLIWKSERKR